MSRSSRRLFLERSMWATASAFALQHASVGRASPLQEGEKESGPSERLSVAVVGVNGRGQSHVHHYVRNPKTRITHICDVDESVGQKVIEAIAEKQGGEKPAYVRDMRAVFEDKTVDIVSVATPNHWHALASLWAVQAGKDVYVEKPVSHNVSEGRRLVQAARKYQRVVQTGTQSRSNPGMRQAMEFIHQGGIGEIKIARGLCYKRRNAIGPKGTYDVPAGVDYDLWLGPAQFAPVTRPRFHYDWHWQWPYGNGDLGNQGIHQMDLCRWALQKQQLSDWVMSYGGRWGYEDAGETANTQVVVHGYGEQQLVFEVRGLETKDYRGASVGIIIEGTGGYLVMTSYSAGIAFDPEGKEIKRFEQGGDDFHYDNFISAVQSRDWKSLQAEIEDGHLSSALCHTANISLRLGKSGNVAQLEESLKELAGPENCQATLERTLNHIADNQVDLESLAISVGPKLVMDPIAEVFPGNDAANAMLTRDYRAPYVIPKEADL